MNREANLNLFDNIQAVCRDYRKQLKRGEVKPIEMFLNRIDEASRGILFQNLLHLDIEFRRRSGEEPSSDDYISRFPAYSRLIRQAFFESTLMSEELSGETPGESDPTMTLEIPAARRLGDYELLRELGRGGFGVVYEAKHLQRGDRVALKTLPNISPRGSLTSRDAERLHKFRREFRSLSEVNHPNLVGMQTLEFDGDQWFFTMDLVDGVDFIDYVRPAGKLDESRLRRAATQLARGIAALHQRGVVHRDLKPSNVLVDSAGQVTILDFGLVAELQHATDQTISVQTKQFAGTPRYAAPEQLTGERTAATDWYALGVMLFEALTGAAPHAGSGVDLMLKKKTEDAPALVAREGIPQDLAMLTDQLLHRDPSERPDSMAIAHSLDFQSEGSELESTDTEQAIPQHDSQVLLIGREQQSRSLEDVYRCVQDESEPRVVFVSGLSGEGKTSLVEAFLGQVRRDGGAFVLQGRCYDRESVPFKAVDSVLDALAASLRVRSPDELDKWMPEDIRYLAHLFPVLRRVPAIEQRLAGDARAIDERQIRYRAFFALRQLMARISRQSPTVLFVDDLQWGDGDSAEVLCELLSSPDAPRILFVGTYRSDEADESPFLKDWEKFSEGRQRAFHQTSLTVEPLTEQQCVDLVAARVGMEASELLDQADELFSDTCGNPYFLEQLIESFDTSTGRFEPIPLDELIDRKLQRLPDNATDLLEVIAVAGQVVSLKEAAEVCEGLANAFSIITHMRSEKLVRLVGPQDAQLVDTYHDKIRETVLNRVDDGQRRDLHGRFAAVIESRMSEFGTDSQTAANANQGRVFDLAHHYFEASDPRAFHWQLRAGQAALDAYAMDNALTHFRKAEQIQPPEMDRRTNYRFKFMHAKAQVGCSLLSQAIRNYTAALDLAEDSEEVAACHFALGELYWIQSEFEVGIESFRRAFAEFGERLPQSVFAKLLAAGWSFARFHLVPTWAPSRLGGKSSTELNQLSQMFSRVAWLFVQMDVPLYIFACARGSIVAKQAGNAEAKSGAYAAYASLLAFTGARWLAPPIMALARKHDASLPEYSKMGKFDADAALYSYCRGRLSEAERELQLSAERMTRSGHYMRSYAEHFLWHLWSVRGEPDKVVHHARNEEVIARRTNDRVILAYAWYGQGEGLALKGETSEAFRLTEKAIRQLESLGGAFLCLAYLQKARVEIQVGDYDQARSSLAKTIRDIPRLRLVELTARVFPLFVEAILADHWANHQDRIPARDRRKAGWAALAGRLCAVAFPNLAPNVLRMSGRLYAARGRTKKAIKHLEKSIAAAESLGAQYDLARGLLDLAAVKVEDRQQNRCQAIELLKQAGSVIPHAEQSLLGDQYDPAVVAPSMPVADS